MKIALLQRGLSLMEVMVVVAILAVAASLSIPLLVNHTERNRLKLASETFYSDVVKAHSEALKTKAPVNLIITPGANWCYGFTATMPSCDCSVQGSCELGSVQASKYKGSVSGLATTSGITGSIQFDGDRGVASPTGTVSFVSESGETVSVIITGMGSAQVCSSDIGGYEPC